MKYMNPDALLQIPRYFLLSDYRMKGEDYHLKFQNGRKSISLTLNTQILKLLLKFTVPTTPRNVSTELKVSLEEVMKVCGKLVEKDFLKPSFTDERYKRYNRHSLYYSMNSLDPSKSYEALRTTTIALVGMGGIGNWMSLNLIGLGLKKIVMIDPDTIEETNLTRQILFSEKDVGQKKVEIAKRELNKRNLETEIVAICEAVSEENLRTFVRGSQFVVLSADSPPHLIQQWTNLACIQENIPFLNVGYSGGIGICGPLVIRGKTGCLSCFQKTQLPLAQFPEALRPLLAIYQTPSYVCLNSTISSLASFEIVKHLLGFGNIESMGHQLQFDPLDFQFRKRAFLKDTSCAVCQES